MNILLLSNDAPNYFNFFNALVKCFAEDGEKVVIAVDSTFSREENGLDALGFPVHDFSEYFVKHKLDSDILERYRLYNLNGALLSDFERAQVFDIWGKRPDINYYDRLKSALLSYYEELFEKYNINAILYENVSNTFAHFALFVAQKKGAKYWGIGSSRLPGRFAITSDPLDDSETFKAFEAIRAGQIEITPEVRNWASDYVESIETVVPDYMKINGLDRIALLSRYLRRDRIKKIRSLLLHAFDSRTDAFQTGNPLISYFNLFKRNLYRRIRIIQVRKIYQIPVKDENFLLYPLHFHPESSTSILAGSYLDEYEVIRNIAFSLPEGVRLYVKDHISAWGYPSLDFYRRIKRLPNVRLLSPNAPTKQLIKDSAGVITLTSTVGYEALLLKKRVYLIGNVFYGFHKGVVRIENPTEIGALVQIGLLKPVDWDDAYNKDFVCAYHEATLPGTLNLMQKGLPALQAAHQLYPVIKAKLV